MMDEELHISPFGQGFKPPQLPFSGFETDMGAEKSIKFRFIIDNYETKCQNFC